MHVKIPAAHSPSLNGRFRPDCDKWILGSLEKTYTFLTESPKLIINITISSVAHRLGRKKKSIYLNMGNCRAVVSRNPVVFASVQQLSGCPAEGQARTHATHTIATSSLLVALEGGGTTRARANRHPAL